MGQYYKPIILDDKKDYPVAWLYSHDYGNGLKLMEHSWLRNDFVSTFERLISPKGMFHGKRVVWAGDYADYEPGTSEGKFPVKQSELDPEMLKYFKERKKEGREVGANLYDYCSDNNKLKPPIKNVEGEFGSEFRYIVNHTTKEYVDKRKVPVSDTWTDPKTNKEYSFRIHPLPLLTCEGNGRGGGDFRGESELVGKWARNVVTAETRKPKGYQEIIFNVKEN